MRLFIAIELPLSLKDKLSQIREKTHTNSSKIKWVEKDNLHLTLKFLGNIEEEHLAKVKEAMVAAAEKFKPFQAEILGAGFFPNRKRARVFFVKTSEEEYLKRIACLLEEKLKSNLEAVFKEEKKKEFKSHITLARIKDSKEAEKLPENIETDTFQIIKVERISLFMSTLTPGGAKYKIIFRAPL